MNEQEILRKAVEWKQKTTPVYFFICFIMGLVIIAGLVYLIRFIIGLFL